MLVHHDTDPQTAFSAEAAEALFKEARRRTRRRRLRRGFAIAVVLGAAALAHRAIEGSRGGVVAESASTPLNSRPIEIEYPLFPAREWRAVATNGLSFYGQINWAGRFNWWSP